MRRVSVQKAASERPEWVHSVATFQHQDSPEGINCIRHCEKTLNTSPIFFPLSVHTKERVSEFQRPLLIKSKNFLKVPNYEKTSPLLKPAKGEQSVCTHLKASTHIVENLSAHQVSPIFMRTEMSWKSGDMANSLWKMVHCTLIMLAAAKREEKTPVGRKERDGGGGGKWRENKSHRDFGLPLFHDRHELISFKASPLIKDVDVFIKGFWEVNKLLADGWRIEESCTDHACVGEWMMPTWTQTCHHQWR